MIWAMPKAQFLHLPRAPRTQLGSRSFGRRGFHRQPLAVERPPGPQYRQRPVCHPTEGGPCPSGRGNGSQRRPPSSPLGIMSESSTASGTGNRAPMPFRSLAKGGSHDRCNLQAGHPRPPVRYRTLLRLSPGVSSVERTMEGSGEVTCAVNRALATVCSCTAEFTRSAPASRRRGVPRTTFLTARSTTLTIIANDPSSASRCSVPASINADDGNPLFLTSSSESANGTVSSALECRMIVF